MMRLSAKEIEKFKAVKPTFVRAQEITQVPWQAIAAVWYRESFSITPPKTPGGSFQFDPVPPNEFLRSLLDRFTTLSDAQKKVIVAAGVYRFEAAAILAACFLRHKTGPKITVDASDEFVRDAFWGYNGRSYGSAENSPYVMNFYDANYCGPSGQGMIVRGTIPDGKGGRIHIHGPSKQLGAFTVYKQLKKLEI
jgi:hypothetical protein